MLTCPSFLISRLCLSVLLIVMTNMKESKASVRLNTDMDTVLALAETIMQGTPRMQKRTSGVR